MVEVLFRFIFYRIKICSTEGSQKDKDFFSIRQNILQLFKKSDMAVNSVFYKIHINLFYQVIMILRQGTVYEYG